jgi:SAM-dependent methyltransferase
LRREQFGLIVVAGVLPHLGSAAEVLRLLRTARRRLTRGGRVVLDDIGPGLLPARDLPLSIDWRRRMHGQRLTRFSQLLRRKVGDGVEVAFSTLVEAVEADGTISRLPASYRLWYPSVRELERLVGAAGLQVELTYGSHDLDPLDRSSERRILVARRTAPRVEP